MNKTKELESLIGNYLTDNCTRLEFGNAIDILKNPNHNLGLQTVLFNKWVNLENQETNLNESEKMEIRLKLSAIHHQINILENGWKPVTNRWALTGLLVKIAAALLLPVMVVSLWYFFSSRKPYQGKDTYITISTPAGSKIKTELPDGTIVWQNSGSTLKYPKNYTRRNRQVIMAGEAFFDVKPDQLHPLYVTTPNLRVKVMGTRFNITDYEGENTSVVVLESGKIMAGKLYPDSPAEFPLVPGDMFLSHGIKGVTISHHIDVEKYTSWINGKLVFRNDPLEEIMKRLSRWYNVEIVVNDPMGKFRNLPFTMTIENESLPQILEYLRHAAPLKIREEKQVLKADASFNIHRYILEYRK